MSSLRHKVEVAVMCWIRDAAPLALKMSLTRDVVEALVSRVVSAVDEPAASEIDQDVLRLTSEGKPDDQLEAYRHGNVVTVEVENAWAGDTMSGFGRNCSVGLDLERARLLGRWLLARTEPGAGESSRDDG